MRRWDCECRCNIVLDADSHVRAATLAGLACQRQGVRCACREVDRP